MIRQQILRVLLAAPKELTQQSDHLSAHEEYKIPFDTRVFATNRQLLAEGQAVFYQHNTLRVNVYEIQPLPLWITSPPPAINGARKVHIWIFYHSTKGTLDIFRQMKKFAQTLKLCKTLEQVRVSPVVQASWHNPELDVAVDKTLDPLKEVRGVGEVLFSDRETMRNAMGLWEHFPAGTEEERSVIKRCMEAERE